MNSFVVVLLVAVAASAQAGFLHAPVAAPVVYHAPAVVAAPIYTASYPTYTVHSPAIAPVIKTLASPVYSSPVVFKTHYAAPVATYTTYGGWK